MPIVGTLGQTNFVACLLVVVPYVGQDFIDRLSVKLKAERYGYMTLR